MLAGLSCLCREGYYPPAILQLHTSSTASRSPFLHRGRHGSLSVGFGGMFTPYNRVGAMPFSQMAFLPAKNACLQSIRRKRAGRRRECMIANDDPRGSSFASGSEAGEQLPLTARRTAGRCRWGRASRCALSWSPPRRTPRAGRPSSAGPCRGCHRRLL